MNNQNREYAFLTMLIPDNIKNQVEDNSKNNMQDAANALQWHIYNGLCSNLKHNIKIFNVLPVGSFPQYYNKPFVNKFEFNTEYNTDNVNIDYCNIKLIRKYIIPQRIYSFLNAWCKSSNSPKTLFVYTISEHFISALEKLKNKFSSLEICAIVADLPNLSSLSSKKKFYEKIFSNHQAKKAMNRIACIDYWVLLSKHMVSYLGIQKPYCVMEGIATNVNPNIILKDHAKKNTILYSGTLHKKFGIMNLLEAFKMIQDENYELIICGVGDSIDEIVNAAEEDTRIRFLGKISREEVLELLQEATVLVNPRQNNEEFTKYSFPSKNLEYLSTGVPLVAYKLDGIPDEYDDYIFYVEDNSIIALKNKIIDVCSDKHSKLKAKKGAEFVLTQKNEIAQTKKIVELITKG